VTGDGARVAGTRGARQETHYICSANALKTPGLCIHLQRTYCCHLCPLCCVCAGLFKACKGAGSFFSVSCSREKKRSCRRLAARAVSLSQLVIREVRLVDVIGSWRLQSYRLCVSTI